MPRKLVLTTEQLNNDDKKYDKLKKITFTSGGYTEVYVKFRPSKIEEMILDFANFLAEYDKSGDKIDNDSFFKFLTLHSIKHFSTLCPDFPTTFTEKLEFMNKLADHQAVVEMLYKYEEIFNKQEVAKIYDAMAKKLEMYIKTEENQAFIKKQLREKIKELENADIIEKVLLGEKSDAIIQ